MDSILYQSINVGNSRLLHFHFAVGEGSGDVPEESVVSPEEAADDLEEKAEAMLEDAAIIGILFGVVAAVALISALVSSQEKADRYEWFIGLSCRLLVQIKRKKEYAWGSVPDPNPDPRVFWPPGSGSTSQRYGSSSGSGSGSFYHHAKIIRKPLNPTILLLFLTFYL